MLQHIPGSHAPAWEPTKYLDIILNPAEHNQAEQSSAWKNFLPVSFTAPAGKIPALRLLSGSLPGSHAPAWEPT